MANQMIALQARNPQLPDPARQTAQMANMLNMVSQQRAAQRQAEQAQQAMAIEAAKEERAKALHGPALTKAQQDNIIQALEIFREGVADVAENDLAAKEAVRADLVARVPGWDKVLPPATSWDRNTRYGLMLKAEKEIDKTVATPVASLELSQSGMPRSVTVGGLNPEQRPVYDAPETPVAPRATPTAPQAAAAPASVGDYGEARFVPDSAVPLTPYQQDHIRQMQSELGMQNTPASFAGGAGAAQMTPDVMSRIVDSAFQTGVMAQVDFDQLLASQPPQNKQALVDSFRRANITLQADAPSLADSAMSANPVQTPQSQFAVYRGEPMQSQTAGLRGAPPMEQTLAQTRTSTPLQMRNPNQPIAPGSSVVPIPRLEAEARAGRMSPAEAAAVALAQEEAKEAAAAAAAPKAAERERNLAFSKERGTADAKFMESVAPAIEAASEGRKILNQMIGDAVINKQGQISIPKGGRSPHSGFESVVGLGFPGMRFVPGTQSADFDKKLKQVLGKAFLKAFNDLKGGGSITEIEGVKATEAITRLSRSTSEVEFVRAARELEDILAKGERRALARRARIEGTAVPSVTTPTSKKGSPKELRFNPATGGFD